MQRIISVSKLMPAAIISTVMAFATVASLSIWFNNDAWKQVKEHFTNRAWFELVDAIFNVFKIDELSLIFGVSLTFLFFIGFLLRKFSKKTTPPDTPPPVTSPTPGNRTVDVDAKKSNIGVISGGDTTVNGGIHFHQHQTFPVSEAGKPLQRPPEAAYFTGRKTQLKKIMDALQPDRIVTLCGPGGIGKTGLASEAIRRLVPGNEPPDLFPDGVVFWTFYGRPSMALAFEHIVKSFDEDAQDTSPETAMRILAGKQALLILDGAEEAEDLRAILDIRGRCGVLVTTRKKKDAETGRLDIAPLPDTDGIKLFGKLAGDHISDAGALEICRLTGGLPLAIKIAGHYISSSGMPAQTYIEELNNSPLAALDHGERQRDSVRILLARSVAQIEAASPRALKALAISSHLALAPFDLNSVTSALSLSQYEAGDALGNLFNYGLLNKTEERYEISHPLIHTYARKHLTCSDEAVNRLTAFFIALVKKESGKGPDGYDRLDTNRIHLMRVLDGCLERKVWEPVLEIVQAAEGYMDHKGHWNDRITLIEKGVLAAIKLEDKKAASAMLGDLGLAHNDIGQLEKAIEYYEQALAISREIRDQFAEGNHLGNLGLAYSAISQFEKAIGYFEKAIPISRKTGNQRGEANHLNNLGDAYFRLSQVEKAFGYYEQALAISREIAGIGGRRIEGRCLGNLGNVYLVTGQVGVALGCYEQGLAISREIGDRRGEGNQLGSLGSAYRVLGQIEKAIDYTKQALAIFEDIKSPHAEMSQKQLEELQTQSSI